jgi:hypothetical protein
MVIINYFVSDIQAMLVCKKEIRIETIQQIVERKDVKVLVSANGYPHRILMKVRIEFTNKNYDLLFNISFRILVFWLQE